MRGGRRRGSQRPGRAGTAPIAGARAARCRVEASSVQDLPDGGRRHGDAKLEQLALDPAVAPQWILPRQAQHQLLDPGGLGGRPGLRHPLVSYFFAVGLRCQARSVAGVTGNISDQRRRDTICASAANQTRSAGSYRTRPTWRRSTTFSCRSTSTSATVAWSLRNSTTIRPGIRHISALADLVRPPSQSSPPSSLSGTVQVNQSIEYSGGTTSCGGVLWVLRPSPHAATAATPRRPA